MPGANSRPPTYQKTPQVPTGYELSPEPNASFWGIVSSEPTTNLIANPSFEADFSTNTYISGSSATLSQSTTFATRGKYGMKVTPTGAVLSSVSMTSGPIESKWRSFYVEVVGWHTWSLDFKGTVGKTYRIAITNGVTNLASVSFTATGNLEHKNITAYLTETSATSTYVLTLEQTSAVATAYYTDAWQLENKAYPTTYVDGNHGGKWTAGTNSSASYRAVNSRGGRTYNFKTDLEFTIDSYFGAGLPDPENKALPRGFLNGTTYQRTTTAQVVFTLVGSVSGLNLSPIQHIRQRMESLFASVASTQQGPPLILLFQLLDPVSGLPAGKLLSVPVYYVDGLKGMTDNANLEKIPLRFICYNPPAIQELEQEIYKSACYKTTVNWTAGLNAATTFGRNVYGWGSDQLEGRAFTMNEGRMYGTTSNRVKELYISGNPTTLVNQGLVQAFGGLDPFTPSAVTVLALVANAGKLYVAGSTNSGNFLRSALYNLDSGDANWTALNFGLNNTSRAVCVERNSGYIYYGGDFTAAGNSVAGDYETQRVAFYSIADLSWVRLGTAGAGNNGVNNTVRALACGLDNTIYIGGDFTTAQGITTTGIVQWLRTGTVTGTMSAVPTGGTGVAGGVVYACAVSPTTGWLFIGGTFTSVNGVTANKIAMWNGSVWLPVGGGLNGQVTCLWFDQQGMLYAGGAFTGTNGTGSYTFPWNIAKINANSLSSSWLPIDIDLVPTDPTINAIAVNNAGDIFVGTSSLGTAGSGSNPYINYSCNTTVTNAGTADVGPKIVITGPGDLWQISNQTAKTNIYFKNLTLQTGELLTIDLTSADNITATSNLRAGSMLQFVLPGSDLATWALLPANPLTGATGDNIITVLIGGTTAAATAVDMYYYNTHWSFDAGVA